MLDRTVIIYNGVQVLLSINKLIYMMMPDTIMTVIGLFCLFVYILGKVPQRGQN
jgi:hypothetical protein